MTTPVNSSVTPSSALPEVSNPMLRKVTAFQDPVDPAALLTDILAIIRRHVVIDQTQAVAITLWVAMTWFMPCINIAPLLIITAPERACGKSQLLSIVLRLVFRGLSAANTSAPFLFRAIEAWQPTVLIDEADTFIRENAEIKGMINAGHTRESAYVGRAVAKDGDFEPTMFCVWAPKALAGIALEKHLSDATMSRGIIAAMRRKLPTEQITRLRHADTATFDVLASQLARFALDYTAQVSNARPALPDELSDRSQDNWEPLLAIAGCAGKEWLSEAVAAALALSKSIDEAASPGNELLADIQEVFTAHGESKISSADLIQALVAESESPWATYNRGRPLTPRQLSKMLSAYDIKSKTVRMGRFETPKGYDRDQFSDAFSRYLMPHDAPETIHDMHMSKVQRQIAHLPGTPPPQTSLHDPSENKPIPTALSNLKPSSTAPTTEKLWQEVVRGSVPDKPRMPVDRRPDSDF